MLKSWLELQIEQLYNGMSTVDIFIVPKCRKTECREVVQPKKISGRVLLEYRLCGVPFDVKVK